ARKSPSDGEDNRLLRVQPGESSEIEPWAPSPGYFKPPADKAIPARRPGFDRSPPQANPIGGPVYVEGAARGDTLVVTLESITVADYSWIALRPPPGPPGGSTPLPGPSAPPPTKVFRHTPPPPAPPPPAPPPFH